MHSPAILLIALLVAGCATTGPGNVEDGPPLYSMTVSVPANSGSGRLTAVEKETIAVFVGSDRSGYIPPDRSAERIAFEAAFPIQDADEDALDALVSHNHNVRVGQALAIGADFDPRTAGFLKDVGGRPLSVTGKISFRTGEALSQGAISGVGVGAAMGVTSVNAINSEAAKAGLQLTPTGTAQVVGSQMIQGAIAGMIAGGIHASMANTAMLGFAKANNFGECIEQTTVMAAHVLGGASPMGHNGTLATRQPAIPVSSGIVKRILVTYELEKPEFNGSTRFVILSATGTYRGAEYAVKYPNSRGWEYRMSNLNQVYLPFGSISSWSGQPSIADLRTALLKAGIQL